MKKEHEVGFAACGGKGFHIRFPNGLTLSTQFGGGDYGSNYNLPIGKERDLITLEAATVEVAVFKTSGDGKWQTEEISKAAGLGDPGDCVMGYVPFENWLKLFDACRAA